MLKTGMRDSMYHLMVLVYQIVAVEHVKTIPGGVFCQHRDLFVLTEIGNILESGCFIRGDIVASGQSSGSSGLDGNAL